MSPDTVSSLFPDRPIRPLPKRRLREKLSPEVASTIRYPPSSLDTIPLFYYPSYAAKDETNCLSAGSTSSAEQEQASRVRGDRDHNTGASEFTAEASEKNDTAFRSPHTSKAASETQSRVSGPSGRPDQPRTANFQPPPSTTSSADGYDSFENNNKKKRKIPSAGDSTLSSTHTLNSEISSLAISNASYSPTSDANGEVYGSSGHYTSSGGYMAGTQGMSGSGRGRLGRSTTGRSPLRTLSDGNSSWIPRTPKAVTPQWAQTETQGPGIISNAIANAEKLPVQGQENMSLLQQQTVSNKSTPASSHFTFTCDSQVPGMQWPGGRGHSALLHPDSPSATGLPQGSSMDHTLNNDVPPKRRGNTRRRDLRRVEKELAESALIRRKLTAERNLENPPKPEDVWICEFCEYESIFGVPPRILIRNYERKARRHRIAEADRKRLLEKAKAKGRKGKKNNKAGTKGNQPPSDVQEEPPSEPPDDQESASMYPENGHSKSSKDHVVQVPPDQWDEIKPRPDSHTSNEAATEIRP